MEGASQVSTTCLQVCVSPELSEGNISHPSGSFQGAGQLQAATWRAGAGAKAGHLAGAASLYGAIWLERSTPEPVQPQ